MMFWGTVEGQERKERKEGKKRNKEWRGLATTTIAALYARTNTVVSFSLEPNLDRYQVRKQPSEEIVLLKLGNIYGLCMSSSWIFRRQFPNRVWKAQVTSKFPHKEVQISMYLPNPSMSLPYLQNLESTMYLPYLPKPIHPAIIIIIVIIK